NANRRLPVTHRVAATTDPQVTQRQRASSRAGAKRYVTARPSTANAQSSAQRKVATTLSTHGLEVKALKTIGTATASNNMTMTPRMAPRVKDTEVINCLKNPRFSRS